MTTARRDNWRRVLGTALVLLGVLTVTQTAYYSREQARVAKCQTEFTAQYTAALTERTQIADQDRDAIDQLVQEIGTAIDENDDRAVQTALIRYEATRQANEEQRNANPLPSVELASDCIKEP